MVEMLGVKAIIVRCGEDKVEFFSGVVDRQVVHLPILIYFLVEVC